MVMLDILKHMGQPPTTRNHLAPNVNSAKTETTCFIAAVVSKAGDRKQCSAKLLLLVNWWEMGESRMDYRPRGEIREWVCPSFTWLAPKSDMSMEDKGTGLHWRTRYRMTCRRRVWQRTWESGLRKQRKVSFSVGHLHFSFPLRKTHVVNRWSISPKGRNRDFL